MSTVAECLSRPDSAAGRLQRAALEVMREHERDGALPTSGRFVFYELEQRGVIPKHYPDKAREPLQDVSVALMRLRETSVIPWDWIIDESRTLTEWNSAATVAEYMRDQLDAARLNPWDGPAPLILTESLSLAGVLKVTAYEYVCPIAATRGQVGGFLWTEVGPLLDSDAERQVLYLGDLDHQGGQIEDNTRRTLQQILGRVLDWRRIAITTEQVDEHGLTPIRKRDNRYRPARTHEAWEAEALGQQTVVSLVVDALDELLPEPLAVVRVREREQRAVMAALLNGNGAKQ